MVDRRLPLARGREPGGLRDPSRPRLARRAQGPRQRRPRSSCSCRSGKLRIEVGLRPRGGAARRRGRADHPGGDRAAVSRGALRRRAGGGRGRGVRAHRRRFDGRRAQRQTGRRRDVGAEAGSSSSSLHARVRGADVRRASRGRLAPARLHGGPARGWDSPGMVPPVLRRLGRRGLAAAADPAAAVHGGRRQLRRRRRQRELVVARIRGGRGGSSARRPRAIARRQARRARTSGEIRVHLERGAAPAAPTRPGLIARARKVFTTLGMHRTGERDGVLIYLAVEDRQLAIVGDEGIHGARGTRTGTGCATRWWRSCGRTRRARRSCARSKSSARCSPSTTRGAPTTRTS